MQIQWYPGHMNKAKNQIQDRLKLVDLVLEIRDARLPQSSTNPVLEQIIKAKQRIIILNKADLADPLMTQQWLRDLQAQQQMALALDAQHTNKLQVIQSAVQELMQAKIQKYQQSGVRNYKLRAMCIGIPNVGKSTILNKLVGKKVAVTGNKPGVTKNQNWLKTTSNLELLDTPGVLWPKIDDEQVGYNLALTGAISDRLIPVQDLAVYALEFWQHEYPDRLQTNYQLTEQELVLPPAKLLVYLTQKWTGNDDFERASRRIIQDIRQGLLGQYTLDRVQVNGE
ncbi:ribosome biogenesis GTPase YlqF [Bombilactobacillus folatiphilus]|uniref:Ribosome biogenesis GTPase A n=1 Tax=Bombilactobacillus folatiphilus TaxID=2923362 RepID=A0ABY4PAL5_9LACO|nr:ribosome biogenesis GTPase YlqF [Bombilactobacillus folatiphilus]UQS82788.1 ribosome biogenesis GTPase YlqF [Bombilactobacillus folatiphilus]